MRIHREGKFLIPISIFILAVLCTGFWLLFDFAGISWMNFATIPTAVIFAGLIVNFFRNPHIPIEKNADHVICPCDGKVVVIEEMEEPVYFKGKRIQISIFMSPLNVHVNRNPIGGKVVFQKYFPGKYLMAFNPKSSTENEMNYVVISDEKREVGFKQIAGFLARRIVWYVKQGDVVDQGAEMGFIKFGSRIDIFLPIGTKINVNLEEVVWGGKTVVAEF